MKYTSLAMLFLLVILLAVTAAIALLPVIKVDISTREGSSMLGLSEAAESLGFKTLGVKINFKTLKNEAPLPCIVHWNKAHFVVVYSISGEKLTISNFWKKSKTQNSSFKISVSDPAFGLLSYTQEEFIKGWIGANADEETEEGKIYNKKFYTNKYL